MNGGDEDVEHKQNEILVVPHTHTIVYPRTVMIHLEHAFLALLTVVCPHRFPTHIALLAVVQHHSVNVVRYLDVTRDESWVSKVSPQVCNASDNAEKVEDRKMNQTHVGQMQS